MSDFLTVEGDQQASVAESPRQPSTNGSLTDVDSPNGDYKPDAATKEAHPTAHGSEEDFDDESYDSEDDVDYDEEDDDDDEPALKYERLAGSVPDLLLKDSASSLAVTDKLIVRTMQSLFFYRLTCCNRRLEHMEASSTSWISPESASNRSSPTWHPSWMLLWILWESSLLQLR